MVHINLNDVTSALVNALLVCENLIDVVTTVVKNVSKIFLVRDNSQMGL